MPRLKLVAGAGFEPVRLTAYETVEPPLLHSRKRKLLEGYRGLAPRSRLFTRQLLFYPFELDSRRKVRKLVADKGVEPLTFCVSGRRSCH